MVPKLLGGTHEYDAISMSSEYMCVIPVHCAIHDSAYRREEKRYSLFSRYSDVTGTVYVVQVVLFSEVAPSFGAGRLETSFIVVGRTFFTYLQLLSRRHAENVIEDQCHLTVSSGVAGSEVAVVVAYVARNEDSGRFTDC